MALFRRNKKKNGKSKVSSDADSEPVDAAPEPRVGVVSGVLSPPGDSQFGTPFESIVERRFGPDPSRERTDGPATFEQPVEGSASPILLEEESDSLNLEIDPMAHIGNATTITGNIVAEEDLEIQGTIEGSVELGAHRLTVGREGVVNASVEARVVEVVGQITGNVVASECVEIKAGGLVGGDIRAPRVIMNDGAIVVGSLDMSAALTKRETMVTPPTSDAVISPASSMPARPKLIKVELADKSSSEEGSA